MIENLPLAHTRCVAQRAAPSRAATIGWPRDAERSRRAIARRAARALGAERLLVAGFCVVYLIAMAGDLLAIAARR